MKARKIIIMLGVVLLASTCFAQGWLIPPPFPVQRHILYQFNTPNDEPYYFGPDDPYLRVSDFVRWSDNVLWLGGRVGIDNMNGTDTMSGWITFHIDNWKILRPDKLIWLQVDGYENNGSDLWLQVTDDTGIIYDWNLEKLVYNPDGTWTELVSIVMHPNPTFEEFTFNFTAPAGTITWIDNLQIATACVPEPGSIIALLVGGSALLYRLRRK